MGTRRLTPTTIVCGPPGAGKSRYVRERKGLNDLVVDVDELFKAMTLLEDRQKPEAIFPFVLEARDAVLRRLGAGGQGPDHAWIIMCGDSNQARAELAAALEARVVVIPTPAGECRARMLRQGRPKWHIDEVAAVAERWHSRFRPMLGERVEYANGYGRAFDAHGNPVDGP